MVQLFLMQEQMSADSLEYMRYDAGYDFECTYAGFFAGNGGLQAGKGDTAGVGLGSLSGNVCAAGWKAGIERCVFREFRLTIFLQCFMLRFERL